MHKARILLTLGVWVAILPYLGFPYFFKNMLLSLTGLGLTYFSYVLYRESKTGETAEKAFDNFSENSSFGEKEINSETKTEEQSLN